MHPFDRTKLAVALEEMCAEEMVIQDAPKPIQTDMNKSLRVVFYGERPLLPVPGLRSIVDSKHELVGVVTAPDRPAGRGKNLRFSAVKEAVLEYNIPLFQPEKLSSEDTVAQLKALDADVFVVVAFRMLPKVVWELPQLGTFNLHASLLPQYRGAAPIHWSIINGEQSVWA